MIFYFLTRFEYLHDTLLIVEEVHTLIYLRVSASAQLAAKLVIILETKDNLTRFVVIVIFRLKNASLSVETREWPI